MSNVDSERVASLAQIKHYETERLRQEFGIDADWTRRICATARAYHSTHQQRQGVRVPEVGGVPLRHVFAVARSRFQALSEYHKPTSVAYGVAAEGVKGCNEALSCLAAIESGGEG